MKLNPFYYSENEEGYPPTLCGELIPISDFHREYYSPYDGSGYWATEEGYSDLSIDSEPKPDWATHIMWFNK